MEDDETHICNVIKIVCRPSANEEQIIQSLNELKKISMQELQRHNVFRNEEFFVNLMKLISCNNSDIQHLVLKIACSYASIPEFIVQVHNHGLIQLMSILKITNHKYIQQNLMHFLCRQAVYEPSKIFLYENNISSLVISTLQCCETDETKFYGIKLLRMLSSSKEKMNNILDEKGLYTICIVGLSLTCSNLCQLTMQFIMSYIKRNCIGPLFFGQVIAGADNLQTFKKILEQDIKYKIDIFEIFLLIFSHHCNCTSIHQYSRNVQVLDYLCMANLPIMIVNELSSTYPDIKIDKKKIILVLCKMCELGSQWRKYSFNVLPSYHDRTWMQISSEKKISIFISLLAAYQNDKELLQAILRAILGLQNLHSNKFYILKQFIESNILLLIAKIFDKALKISCDYVNNNVITKCNHYNPPKITKCKSNSFVKLIPPDILDFISQPTDKNKLLCVNRATIKPRSNSMKESEGISLSVLNRPNYEEVCTLEPEKAYLPPLPNPNSQFAVVYKEINKIKFRTGNKDKKSKRDRSLSVSEGFKGGQHSKNIVRRSLSSSLSYHSNRKGIHDHPPTTEMVANKCIDETTHYWVKILEYLVRFLHQILVFKEDVNNICKEFLPKFYTYLSKACIVHDSANLILEALAKNTSCIQYVLDILFIPMLVVDLRNPDLSVSCPQCTQINKGINTFLDKIGFFFSHFHQYGRCEIANRLNPSKDANVKNSSLVAVTHVTKCPSLLYDFLIEHRGLDQLLSVFSSFNFDEKIHLYAIASVSSLMANMKISYIRKYNICIFCDTNVTHLLNSAPETSKCKKNQLLFLTSSALQNYNLAQPVCKVNDECNKNCCFKLNDGKRILANKELLSVKNEVLKNMLLGSFSESLENCVEIKDVTSHVMEMVVHFAYGCTCDIFLCKDVSIYAELLFVAEMYFIPELQILAMHFLSEFICFEKITAFLDEYIHLMNDELLQHLFCSLLSHPGLTISNKAQLVDHLLLGKEKDTFIRNVQIGVSNIMKQISRLCNCDVFYEPIH